MRSAVQQHLVTCQQHQEAPLQLALQEHLVIRAEPLLAVAVR